MNRIVETPSRIRRFAVVGRRALSAFGKRCSKGPKGATPADQGATTEQQGFHNDHGSASAFAHEGSGAVDGFTDEKSRRLNTAAGYGINLYLIG
jgi:hypothetical protein